MSKALSAVPVVPREPGFRLTVVPGSSDAHVLCPDPACSHLAVVEDRWSFGSTDGALGMAKVRCTGGCWYTVPEDDLQAA